MTADLRENCHFGAFHIFTYFSPKWANIYFSSVLWSTGGCFHHFKRLFGELKKLKIFPTFHKFAYFSSKWANIYISSVLWSTGGDLLKFFMTCEKNVILGHFTFSLISHPNEQIFTFQVSCGQFSPTPALCEKCHFGIHKFAYFSSKSYLYFKCPVVNWWWFSSVLKTFQKVEKIEVFHDRGPARELSFWGISHFHLFLTQMSKYLLFKCPVVNWWLFSSF